MDLTGVSTVNSLASPSEVDDLARACAKAVQDLPLCFHEQRDFPDFLRRIELFALLKTGRDFASTDSTSSRVFWIRRNHCLFSPLVFCRHIFARSTPRLLRRVCRQLPIVPRSPQLSAVVTKTWRGVLSTTSLLGSFPLHTLSRFRRPVRGPSGQRAILARLPGRLLLR